LRGQCYTVITKLNKEVLEFNRVIYFRKRENLSQINLAKKVGVSRQTINMIENDKYNPSLKLCKNIAKALNTDLNKLFWSD